MLSGNFGGIEEILPQMRVIDQMGSEVCALGIQCSVRTALNGAFQIPELGKEQRKAYKGEGQAQNANIPCNRSADISISDRVRVNDIRPEPLEGRDISVECCGPLFVIERSYQGLDSALVRAYAISQPQAIAVNTITGFKAAPFE